MRFYLNISKASCLKLNDLEDLAFSRLVVAHCSTIMVTIHFSPSGPKCDTKVVVNVAPRQADKGPTKQQPADFRGKVCLFGSNWGLETHGFVGHFSRFNLLIVNWHHRNQAGSIWSKTIWSTTSPYKANFGQMCACIVRLSTLDAQRCCHALSSLAEPGLSATAWEGGKMAVKSPGMGFYFQKHWFFIGTWFFLSKCVTKVTEIIPDDRKIPDAVSIKTCQNHQLLEKKKNLNVPRRKTACLVGTIAQSILPPHRPPTILLSLPTVSSTSWQLGHGTCVKMWHFYMETHRENLHLFRDLFRCSLALNIPKCCFDSDVQPCAYLLSCFASFFWHIWGTVDCMFGSSWALLADIQPTFRPVWGSWVKFVGLAILGPGGGNLELFGRVGKKNVEKMTRISPQNLCAGVVYMGLSKVFFLGSRWAHRPNMGPTWAPLTCTANHWSDVGFKIHIPNQVSSKTSGC